MKNCQEGADETTPRERSLGLRSKSVSLTWSTCADDCPTDLCVSSTGFVLSSASPMVCVMAFQRSGKEEVVLLLRSCVSQTG